VTAPAPEPFPRSKPPQPRPLRACGWCSTTHVADAICTCDTPCLRAHCPAAAEDYTPPAVPTFRRAS
jgi:hypothetical protein